MSIATVNSLTFSSIEPHEESSAMGKITAVSITSSSEMPSTPTAY